MATYKGIKGFTIQNLSADPSNPIEGEMWYNSTSNVWKVEEATAAGAWATGGSYDGSTWTTSPSSLATARYSVSGAGTQTAGLAFGGTTPAGADRRCCRRIQWFYLDNRRNYGFSKKIFSRVWITNSRFSFWWFYYWNLPKYYRRI
jgi:hypothetical protein